MFKHILVALDGSKLADRALPFAERIAVAERGTIWLVRAADTWALTPKRKAERDLAIRREGRAELSSLSLAMNLRGINSDWEVTSGEASAVIAAAARGHDADLIVMSTRGRGGRSQWGYGSVAERVLQTAPCPVLLIPPKCADSWENEEPRDRPIVVPLDGSPLAEGALETAKELALVLSASLLLLHVLEPAGVLTSLPGRSHAPAGVLEEDSQAVRHYLAGVAHDLRLQEYPVEWHAPAGYAEATIARLAEERRAAAIVMATHGRGGFARMVIGSVVSGVVQRANVPVVTTRQH